MLICHSCAANPSEAAFPTIFRRGRPRLCLDCTAEVERQREARTNRFVRAARTRRADWQTATIVVTRASYRAALRHRQSQPQADLVDAVMPRP